MSDMLVDKTEIGQKDSQKVIEGHSAWTAVVM